MEWFRPSWIDSRAHTIYHYTTFLLLKVQSYILRCPAVQTIFSFVSHVCWPIPFTSFIRWSPYFLQSKSFPIITFMCYRLQLCQVVPSSWQVQKQQTQDQDQNRHQSRIQRDIKGKYVRSRINSGDTVHTLIGFKSNFGGFACPGVNIF